MTARVDIAGLHFSPIGLRDVVREVARRMATEKLFLCLAPVDSVVMARRDPEFRRVLNESSFLLADGMPVVWASRLLGTPLPERVAGPDLFHALLDLCREHRHSAFFLGSDEATVAQFRRRTDRNHVPVCGHFCPPQRTSFDAVDLERMTAAVNRARPDFLFVVLGAPKQELWAGSHLDRLDARVIVPIGAAFNVYAGALRRVPPWARAAGLEWLGRLAQEPRLWRRYGRDTVFLAWVVRMLLEQRRGARA